MKKIKKIEIKVNGKKILINDKEKLSKILRDLKIPIKKVAIEINREIIIKKKLLFRHRIDFFLFLFLIRFSNLCYRNQLFIFSDID